MKYYTIVTQEQLYTILPDEVINYRGYVSGTTLYDATVGFPTELEDGTFLINVQLSRAIYIKERCTIHEINEQELEFARMYYDNIITDISDLKIKIYKDE